MTSKLVPTRGIIHWLLIFTVPTLIECLDHYCQQDLDAITGETEGKVITRQQGETYYGNNYDCSWLIDAGEGKKIKLTVLSTNLEWAPTYTTCSQYDNLKIIEGELESGDVITALCGDRNPYHVISQGQYLFLTFKTTHQNFADLKGIELHFEVFDNNTCPPGWFASGENWCISVNQGKAQWLKSQTICSYSRANLASITSAEEFQLIFDHGVNVTSEAWIGLNDQVTEGRFTWIDREKLSFQRMFSKSKPNYDGYDCVAQSFSGDVLGEWTVERCDTDLSYICKARKDGTTKIYSAVQSSDSPEAGGEKEKVNFIVIIVVCIGAVLIGAGIVVLILMKRQHPEMCSRKPKNSQKQELSTTRYTSQERTNETMELDDGGFSQRDRTARPSAPSAPPGEANVMVADPQQIAPPTYEESRYDPVAPANY